MGGFSDNYIVPKKWAWGFGLGAVVMCVLVGVITYYGGVANLPQKHFDSSAEPSAEPIPSSEPEPSSKHAKVTDVRLPLHLIPEKYKLELVPFIIPDNFTIRGYVEVEMKAVIAGDNVTLHVADMTLDNDTVTVEEIGGDKITMTRQETSFTSY